MKPIKTDRTNFTYKGPTPDVMDLPVERATVDGAETKSGSLDGAGVVFSVWEPSPEEREFVARGGNIKLGIYGMEPIPPVSLQIVHEGMAEYTKGNRDD